MFRCITELKSIAIDFDSIPSDQRGNLSKLNQIVKCIFLTSKKETKQTLISLYGEEKVFLFEEYKRVFVPNISFHQEVLKQAGVKNTELVYLSYNLSFLQRANCILSGTIWITSKVTYRDASQLPDMIVNDIAEAIDSIQQGIKGFFGEAMLSPIAKKTGLMTPVQFSVDNEIIPLYTLGRYFSKTHIMGQLHPYSTAIALNKREGKPYTGVFDRIFASIYEMVIESLKSIHDLNCVCSVPTKPGKLPRFDDILTRISNKCALTNIGDKFTCRHQYSDQKTLSSDEREKNVKGAFCFQGDLTGQHIILIDDIVTTGSTLKECARELKRHGAKEVVIVVLAINQLDVSYFSFNTPQCSCSICGEKMSLMVNREGRFFYSCYNCYQQKNQAPTMSFLDGWKQLCDEENKKIASFNKEELVY